MSVSALLNGILDINVKKITTNEVSSNGGDILIDAYHGKLQINGTTGAILIDGTTTFVGNNHIGQATIPSGDSEIVVPFDGMNNDAVILITPMGDIVNFWVEPTTDQFTIHTATTLTTDVKFSYFILKFD